MTARVFRTELHAPDGRWYDVTDFVTGVSTRRGRSYELDKVETGTATIAFDNADGRFTPGRDKLVLRDERFGEVGPVNTDPTSYLHPTGSGDWLVENESGTGVTAGPVAGGGISVTAPNLGDVADSVRLSKVVPIGLDEGVYMTVKARATNAVSGITNIALWIEYLDSADDTGTVLDFEPLDGRWWPDAAEADSNGDWVTIVGSIGTPDVLSGYVASRFVVRATTDVAGLAGETELEVAWVRIEGNNPNGGLIENRVPVRTYSVLGDNWIHPDCVHAETADIVTPRFHGRFADGTPYSKYITQAIVDFDPVYGGYYFQLNDSDNTDEWIHTAGLSGDVDAVQVVAGQQISVDAFVCPVGDTVNASVALVYDGPGATGPAGYDVAFGDNITSVGVLTHSNLTFTAPGNGVVWAGLYVEGDMMGSVGRIAGLKMRLDGVGTSTAEPGSGMYPLFRGFVEKWTSRGAGHLSTAEATCADALALLSVPVESYYRDKVRQYVEENGDQTVLYWPCVESEESDEAVPRYGDRTLTIRTANGGTGTFTTNKTMTHGDGPDSGGFTIAGLDGDTDMERGAVLSLVHGNRPAPPPSGDYVQVGFWYRGGIPPSPYVSRLFGAYNANGDPLLTFTMTEDGDVNFFYSANGVPGAVDLDYIFNPNLVEPDVPVYIGVHVGWDGEETHFTTFVGSVGYFAGSYAAKNVLTDVAYCQWGGRITPGYEGDFTHGTFNHIHYVAGPYSIPFLNIQQSPEIYEAKVEPRDGFTDDGHIDQLLDIAGWDGARKLDPGMSLLLSPRWANGAQAYETLTEAAESASGMLFAGAAGEMTYHNRLRRVNAPVRWRLSEWMDGLTFELDDQRVYNVITAERSTGMKRTARSEFSVGTFGARGLTVKRHVNSPTELSDAAHWLLRRLQTGKVRCESLTIEGSTDTDLANLAIAHGADLSHRLILEDLSPTAPSEALDFFIEGVSTSVKRNGTSWEWYTTLQVSDATNSQAWVLESSETGVLETDACVLSY